MHRYNYFSRQHEYIRDYVNWILINARVQSRYARIKLNTKQIGDVESLILNGPSSTTREQHDNNIG